MKQIIMSMKETERISILDKLLEKRIKQKHASQQLGISIRQVRRLMKRYKREGIAGLTHKSRGRAGNRALSQAEKDQVKQLIREHYSDFGPTLAREKLRDRHGILHAVETIRSIMTLDGIWTPKRRKGIALHPYRERRSCIGELEQLDGSYHKWFETRAPACCLIAFIDDATSRIMDGLFTDHEGTFTLFQATEHYLSLHGRPLALYVDRHSTYKVNRQATIEEELRDSQPLSQFSRAMETLGIEVIYALSSQAKGRIERLFETLQDRLVKELRLEGISDPESATEYFRSVYIPRHNAQFAITAKDPVNMHKALIPAISLAEIFTLQTPRVVSKDLVVQYKNSRFLLTVTGAKRYILPKTTITVHEASNGNISFWHKETKLPFTVLGKINQQQKLIQIASAKTFKEQRVVIPGKDHPWRQRFLPAI
jgi:transposase